jgi:hypothetical protein
MESHNERVDELEQQADHIQEPSKELESEIEDIREDWDSKKKQEAVPGAVKTNEEIEAENYEEPNEFEFEERRPETAEAQGPSAIDEPDSDGDDNGS